MSMPSTTRYVIAGQGTIALEMLADAPDIDTLVVPVGGGGLLAGIATAARALKPSLTIVGVQAAGAPACVESFACGTRQTLPVSTIADGIAVAQPGAHTFPIIHELVDQMVTVDDEAMARAMVLLLEREKLLAEAAGAAGLAAALGGALPAASKNVGVLISGGNVDPNLLDKCIQTGLASAGRFLAFKTWLPDRPGALHRLTGVLTEERVNILHVEIQRIGPYTAIGPVGLEMIVETRNTDHAAHVLDAVRAAGYPVEVVRTRASEGCFLTPCPSPAVQEDERNNIMSLYDVGQDIRRVQVLLTHQRADSATQSLSALFERIDARVPALADGLPDAECEGRIGVDRLGDATGEGVRLHRDDQFVQDVARVRPDDVRARDLPAADHPRDPLRREDDLDEPLRLAHRDRAVHAVEGPAKHFDLVAVFLARLFFGHADARDLRIGEGRPWHDAVIRLLRLGRLPGLPIFSATSRP